MLHEAAPCTCGLLYGSCGGGCSLLFAAAAAGGDHHHHYYRHCGGDGDAAGFGGGPYGGSVDCTLSLGTPSTRRAEAGAARAPAAPSGAGLHWESAPAPSCNNGGGRQHEGGAARGATAEAGARRCANCDTTSTPLWRNGPRGPKSLCNACGIRYKKEERRAAAAAVAPAALASSDAGVVEYASYGYARQPQQWGCYGPAAAAKAAASFGMFGDAGGEVDGPCLPWGLGVMPASSPAFGAVREMPSLFQYY